MSELEQRVAVFTKRRPIVECTHKHQIQGTGAVFYQSVGVLECIHCQGWQLIRKGIK